MMGWWQQTNNPLLYHNNTNDSTIFLVFVAKMLGEGCLKHCNVSYFSRTQSNWAGLAHYGAMPEAEVVECATTTKRCILCAIHQCSYHNHKNMPPQFVCIHTSLVKWTTKWWKLLSCTVDTISKRECAIHNMLCDV
jgi:hypothetical protein